jgi:NTP pyrophosphatase (non-canonical NTP hydrolase)
MQDIDSAVGQFSTWVDSTYPDALHPHLLIHRRLGKVTEEVGEVTDAIGGYFGENPRKGITHTLDGLQGELLDVAVAALGAWEHLDGNTGRAGTALLNRFRSSRWPHQPMITGEPLEQLNGHVTAFTAEFTGDLPSGEPAELSMRRRHADLTVAAGNLARELTAYTTDDGETVTLDGLMKTLLSVAAVALSIHENTAACGATGTALAEKLTHVLHRSGAATAE